MIEPPTIPTILAKQHANLFVVTINTEGTLLHSNTHFKNIFPSFNEVSFNTIIGYDEGLYKAIQTCVTNQGTTISVDFELHIGDQKKLTEWNFTAFELEKNILIYGTGFIKNKAEPAGFFFPDKQANDRINRILESISDGFFAVNQDLTIIYCNHRAEEIFNTKREQILGKNLSDINENSIPENFYAEFQHAFKINSAVHFQEYFPLLNTWFDVSAYPYENLLSIFFVDISRKKKTEEEVAHFTERLKLVAKATKDVIWDWDLITNEVVWNENVTAMFGFSIEHVNANPNWWYDNLHEEEIEAVKKSIETHIEDKHINWQIEYKFRCADGSYKHIHDRGFVVYNSSKHPVRMIGAMQDLTDRKANEFILKELNNSLERRARELANSNDELERFAYVTSHDLQEPLRMVSSFLQLLKKRYTDKLDIKAQEYIGFAVDGAERMKILILDLLEYSRVNTNKEFSEEVDLNEVVAQVHLTYKDLLEEQHGQIHTDHLPLVRGNRTQLLQLFQNLVSNGIKYNTNPSPQVRITSSDNHDNLTFAVSDNGIGMEPRFFKKIFIIFQRLHHKNEYSGTGIGLAICKKIVDKHGGQIWVESEPGKGSIFYFSLPK